MWKDRFVLGKNQVFKADVIQDIVESGNLRMEVKGDRTYINLESLSREYKLAQAYASIRNLEYRSDKKIMIQSFKDYLTSRGDLIKLLFNAQEKPRPNFPSDEAYRNNKTNLHYPKGDLLVLVDQPIYNDIASSIDQYVLDVGRDGYWATIHVLSGGTPANVRSYINQYNPVGVLMVGAIPAAWYELHDDFHGVHSSFPCDLYYMDTTATWTDPDGDGNFDSHTNNLNPDIWIGRIWTPTENGNDVSLINDYFARNHKFRLGLLGQAQSSMAYVDDDWTYFDDCEMDSMFPSSQITTYTNPTMTDADLYKAEVNSLRSWVQLCAHSSTHSHSLRVGTSNEYIRTDYFRDTNPPNAHFYNLFCCGPGRFTSNDYLAGWYIFDKADGGINAGLTAVASAKSGSMLYFADFYRPLGNGKTIGDAYLEWWKVRAVSAGGNPSNDERRWFYGLVLLGDPTLTWWKGVVPQLQQPQQNDEFDHWPRKIQFRWDPINIPGVKYIIEIDAFHAVNAGQWAEETGQSFVTYHNITGNTYDHFFVGMQPGRWRVRAKIGNTLCSWTPWSYFKFTI